MSISLNIPNKTLDDNFKLLHFQEDFNELLNLTLGANAKPKKIDLKFNNEMNVYYEDGRIIQYRFEKLGTQITRIINLTDNKETVIEW